MIHKCCIVFRYLLASAKKKLNITILVSTSFAIGTTNLTTQMKAIKECQARIILFIGTIVDQQTIIDNSLIEGLVGPGYQWVGTHASMYRALYLNSTGERFSAIMNGHKDSLGYKILLM